VNVNLRHFGRIPASDILQVELDGPHWIAFGKAPWRAR
jgi:hypothetical protein